jgi:hypothetical protein
LLKKTGKLGVKPTGTPMEINIKLETNNCEPLPNIEQYQQLVEKLIYLTVTRPDITFIVSMVSQFMHAPCIGHLNSIDRILRYISNAHRIKEFG